jgi:hypothetical protein
MNLTAKMSLTDEQFTGLTRHVKDFDMTCRILMHQEYNKARRIYGDRDFGEKYYLNIIPVKNSSESYYELIAEYTR